MNKVSNSLIFLLLIICISCSAPRKSVQTQNKYLDNLSRQLENSNYNTSVKEEKLNIDTISVKASEINSPSPTVASNKKRATTTSKAEYSHNENHHPLKNLITKKSLDKAATKKFDNPFWKVGTVMFGIGLVILLIGFFGFVSVITHANSFDEIIWILVMMFGLLGMLISIPIILVGLIIGLKHQKKQQNN